LNNIIFSLLAVILLSCNPEKRVNNSNKSEVSSKPDIGSFSNPNVTIGTFNIKWLGDGKNDRFKRTEQDYQKIAEVILSTGADILALQEIENNDALSKLLKYLQGWKGFTQYSGYILNTAYICKNGIEIEEVGLFEPLRVIDNKTRPGYIAKVKINNFDFVLFTLHFKSTSRYDNTAAKKEESFRIRNRQSKVLSDWINQVLDGQEQDYIILGDYNDNPIRNERSNLSALSENANIEFVSLNLGSCNRPEWDNIDHIILSQSAKKRLLENSVRMIDFRSGISDLKANMVSDHCPVVATFITTSPDND
jgi:endonuclease/exonuclease/phosphatase family metal-dependent hydrolase